MIWIALLGAFGLGIVVGWLVWGWRKALVSVGDWEEAAALADVNSSTIIDLRERRTRLETELGSVAGRLDSAEAELAASGAEVDRLSRLERASREAVGILESDVATRNGRIAALEADIASRDGRIAALGAELVRRHGRITALEADLASRDGRIVSTETELAFHRVRLQEIDAERSRLQAELDEDCGHDAEIARLRAHIRELEGARVTAPAAPAAWAVGTTALGTPGAAHTDDLKVINGVGPKMEAVLNGFGVTAWEQVAALTPEEVSRVTDAIDTFPGRISRDRWVEQASDLVRRFPDVARRPTRETFLDASDDEPRS